MLSDPKHVFWQAFVAAVIIFGFGIWLGFLLENYRISKAGILFARSEVDLLDIRLQSEIYKDHAIDCGTAVKENIAFGDRVYEEAKVLDRQKQANKLTEDIVYQHKKYDVLRMIFWLNSISIKERCNSSYHNVVYLYQYTSPSLDKKAEQGVISDVLRDLKEKYGSDIMLIPLAADNNITSVKLLMSYYNISSLPTILIDEKIKFEGLPTLDELEKVIAGSSPDQKKTPMKLENPFV